jgi:hypothetical protein
VEKIKTLFVRDPLNLQYVTDRVEPGFEEVLEGGWAATRKYNGTAVWLNDGRVWYGRRRVKEGRPMPEFFIPVYQDARNPTDTYGWELGSVWRHREALYDAVAQRGTEFEPGTYELIGPSINGNPEKWQHHALINHRTETEGLHIPQESMSFGGLREFFLTKLGPSGYEGVVWHGPKGEMVKLKVSDFRE